VTIALAKLARYRQGDHVHGWSKRVSRPRNARMFCSITPDFLVIPGTKGMKGYKDYFFHLRAFLRGMVLCILAALGMAGVLSLL